LCIVSFLAKAEWVAVEAMAHMSPKDIKMGIRIQAAFPEMLTWEK
jgi:hypothetical protein